MAFNNHCQINMNKSPRSHTKLITRIVGIGLILFYILKCMPRHFDYRTYGYHNNSTTNLTALQKDLEKFMNSKINSDVLFDRLIELYPTDSIITQLWNQYNTSEAIIAKKVFGAKNMHRMGRNVKTIGICYTQMHNGGIARVISLHTTLFTRLGYKVVLFTDSIQQGREFPIAKSVQRVVILFCLRRIRILVYGTVTSPLTIIYKSPSTAPLF